jgi:hypothetical protein
LVLEADEAVGDGASFAGRAFGGLSIGRGADSAITSARLVVAGTAASDSKTPNCCPHAEHLAVLPSAALETRYFWWQCVH